MEATMQYHNNSGGFPTKLVLLVLVLLVMAGGYVFIQTQEGITHSVKHSDSALAQSCFDKYGTDFTYAKEDEQKRVEFCMVPLPNSKEPGRFERAALRVSVKIKGQWIEITKFTDSRFTSIQTAMDFAEEDMGTHGYFTFVKGVWKAMFKGIITP